MLEIGKLDSKLLEEIVFDKIKYRSPEVLTKAGLGEDCAVIDFGEYDCILSTDPITAAVEKIGNLSIHISCNDIASNGVKPLGIMLAILLPEGTRAEDVEKIMDQASKTAASLEVEIIGGHTEITRAVNQPVIVSTAIGKGMKSAAEKSGQIQAGDIIMISKKAGLEGTGIIATDHRQELAGILSSEEIAQAAAMLDQVSVVKEGYIAGQIGTTAMHDITEGGILGAAYEMCQGAGFGGEIFADSVPLAGVTKKICDFFGIDPLGLISSGSMMIIAHEKEAGLIEEALKKEEIEITRIGKVLDKSAGLTLHRGGESIPIGAPQADEIYKMGEKR